MGPRKPKAFTGRSKATTQQCCVNVEYLTSCKPAVTGKNSAKFLFASMLQDARSAFWLSGAKQRRCGLTRAVSSVKHLSRCHRTPPSERCTQNARQNQAKKRRQRDTVKKKAPCPASREYESPFTRRRASTRCIESRSRQTTAELER